MLYIFCDIGDKYNIQEEATYNLIGMRELHEIVMYYALIIIIIVTYMLFISSFPKFFINFLSQRRYSQYYGFFYKFIYMPKIKHNTLLELIWTITPGFILIFIGIPSLQLLYNNEENWIADITLKIKGLQWYWSYELSDDIINISYDSYPLDDISLINNDFQFLRNLEVDHFIFLPIFTDIRLLVTAEDVIHSWTIPSLGIKVDAIPGRINQTILFILREGTFFGQCSELCGLGHPYMPIGLKVVSLSKYIQWLLSNTQLLFFSWYKVFFTAKDFF